MRIFSQAAGLTAATWLTVGVVACGVGSNGTDPSASAAPSTHLSITAENVKFDKKTLVAVAGHPVSLQFENQDASVQHNVAIYRDKSAKESIFRGDIFNGVKTVTYSLPGQSVGEYFFRCDTHPDMNGAYSVR